MNIRRPLSLSAMLFAAAVISACNNKPPEATPAAPTPAEQAANMAAQHAGDAPVASPAAQQSVAPDLIESQTVTYGTLKGQPLRGYFVKPAAATGTLPGVLVFHEWWGLNDNIRRMSDRLAAKGYAVLAADMYLGKTAQTPAEAQKLMQQALSDGPLLDRNIKDAYDYLKDTAKVGKLATLGWCFGGSMSFEAAQVLSGKTDATVIYYGFVNDRPEALKKMTAPVIGFFGGKDGNIPLSTVIGFQKGLEALGKRPQIHIYPDAGHAFANPSGKTYNARDADDAWKYSLDFLAENLGS